MYKKIAILLFIFSSIPIDLYADDKRVGLGIGNPEAKVIIKVFSSLTCPHCAHFHEKIYKNLKKEFIDTGKVRFEHHGFPLDLAALNAEKILRCVKNNDKSFQFLSEIYKKQNKWAVGSDINKINESLKKIGLNFNLDSAKIDSCLKDENTQDKILNERIQAQKKYKITSTPTIYINEKKYEGKHDYKKFKKMVIKNL
ncbi:MAG: hypothetical protein CNC06_02830 [Pelagibacterales bacterium MED-G40]|nr:MAG: hypothetical protein CNC06_02830 [Pelagibacterales bacterium MED-G40]|tara:strand:- start:3301 stop:3894 length:594 start_codon:yes stop_codon:yes gene_type:complete